MVQKTINASTILTLVKAAEPRMQLPTLAGMCFKLTHKELSHLTYGSLRSMLSRMNKKEGSGGVTTQLIEFFNLRVQADAARKEGSFSWEDLILSSKTTGNPLSYPTLWKFFRANKALFSGKKVLRFLKKLAEKIWTSIRVMVPSFPPLPPVFVEMMAEIASEENLF